MALSVLAAALTIPHERLRPAYKKKIRLPLTTHCNHPEGDAIRHQSAAAKYVAMLDDDFATVFGKGWTCGKLEGEWGRGTLRETGELNLAGVTVDDVLSNIRNALAHASIRSIGDPIEAVRFASTVKPYHASEMTLGDPFEMTFVKGTLSDLARFMKRWKEFLASLVDAPPDQSTTQTPT